MAIAIILLIVFTILVIEIPFYVFINLSIDRLVVEYMLSFPIKLQGYSHLKDGNLSSGNSKKRKNSNFNTMDNFHLLKSKIIIKSLHIRGILGDDKIENTMLECVLFENLANGILNYAKSNNQTAKLSQGYDINAEEDSNIFIKTVFWFSVLDLITIFFVLLANKIAKKRR